MLTVQGTVTGDVHLRGGVMLVAGVWMGRLVERDGQLGLAVGTVVDGQRVLRSDGGLQRITGDKSSVNITTDLDSYRFLTPDDRFVPINDLRPSDEATESVDR